MNHEKLCQALKKKNYTVHCFDNRHMATAYLNQTIDKKTVGFGDAQTLITMGLYELLLPHNTVFDPQHCVNGSGFLSTARQCLTTDVFITSVNAIAQTGELVNIDGVGNRIAASLFGHEKVYFVIGKNKIAPDLDQAIFRARNVAAPLNAHRLGLRTPCAAKADRCYDCTSMDRICNGLVVHYNKMKAMDMEVVLIDENLGF